MKLEQFEVGDILRVQLDPEGVYLRYDISNGVWFDRGYGGIWVDATVFSKSQKAFLIGTMFESTRGAMSFNFPVEGSVDYPTSPVGQEGWICPVNSGLIPSCGCGSDKNVDAGTHYWWCPKRQFLEEHGLF